MASFCAKKCSLISIDVYSTYNSSYLAIVEEMFHVNSSSNNAKCLKFYRRKVYNSLQEIATLAIIWEISDSNLETTRYSLKSGVSWIIWESWQHCNDYVNLSLIYLSLLKLQWHAKVCEETFHVWAVTCDQVCFFLFYWETRGKGCLIDLLYTSSARP